MDIATYFILNASVLVVATIALRRYLCRERRVWWVLLSFMVPLTIIFDSLCIYLGIFHYGPDTVSGLRIGPMPIEDLFYTVVAVMIVPALWNFYGERKEAKHAG